MQKDLLHHLLLVLDKLNLACKIPLKHKGGPNHTQGFQRWISHGSNNLVIERKLIKEMGRRQPRLNDLDLSTTSLLQNFIGCFNWGNIDKSGYTHMLEELKQIEEKKEKALADFAQNPNIFNSLTLRNAIEEQIKNSMYDEYVSLLNNAKELARNKDVAALRKLSHQQVEEFMSEWNHPYVKLLESITTLAFCLR